ncbi:hypothetical protein LTR53_017483, partial [Teratosphaeriaceae sp. CCFEE 6253]
MTDGNEAATPLPDSPAELPQDHAPSQEVVDRTRDSEFYKYYEPFKAAIASGARSRLDGVLRSSDDRALTAFAQLGALRLGARRCAISFFDGNTQFVLAEATKTLSLHTDEPDDPKDALLWGVAEFPLVAGLCQYTLRLPMRFEECADGGRTEVAVNCVPDMSKDSRFADLPFICGEPHTRFYAAVPIRSPSGVPLGSYCVMGDEPKLGLTSSETAFLKDMATTVMVHLEMVRAREEIRRNALVIQGLGSFVEGESSIWGGRRMADESLRRGYAGQKWYDEQYAMQRMAKPRLAGDPSGGPNRTPSTGSGVQLPMEARQAKPVDNTTGLRSSDHAMPTQRRSKSSTAGSRLRQSHELDINHTFARAASIIRECTDVDGVALYDASVGTFGGMVDTDSGSESAGSSSSTPPGSPSRLGADAHSR